MSYIAGKKNRSPFTYPESPRGGGGATGATGATGSSGGPVGPTGATGAAGVGSGDYAFFYSVTPSASTAPGVAMAFPVTGPASGTITRSGPHPNTDFIIANAGVYEVSYQVSDTTGATQFELATGGFGVYTPVAGTTMGRAVGATQINGRVFITATAGMILSVFNPAGNANNIVQTPPDGSETVQQAATLTIHRIA